MSATNLESETERSNKALECERRAMMADDPQIIDYWMRKAQALRTGRSIDAKLHRSMPGRNSGDVYSTRHHRRAREKALDKAVSR
jgi:hypothetical protein